MAKHAQHVVLVHFPIALFVTGVVFDLLSRGKLDSQLASAAYLNLSGAKVMALPSVVTGVLAWQFLLAGKSPKGLLLLHLMAASFAGVLVAAAWWVHWQAGKSRLWSLRRYRIAVELVGVAIIALTAHLGGFLSGSIHKHSCGSAFSASDFAV